jgi:hypothetical protein
MSLPHVRVLRYAAVVLGLFAGAAGCSNQRGLELTRPSAVPDSLAVVGGTVRYYKATMSPTSVNAGSTTTFSVTITNCSAATCDATHATTSTQKMGSATIGVPSGFVVDASSFSVSATGGKTWLVSLVAGTIQLVADPGTQKLDPGESVTVTFDADAPCANANYQWPSVGFNGTDFSTPYVLFGAQPSVAVTGTCAQAGCTLTQGYWKTHATGWPVSGLTLGSVSYTNAQLLAILNEPVAGNGLISLAHQLIAAKLNLASWADGSAIASTVPAADALIGALVIPPGGAGWLAPSSTSALTTALDDYNNGVTGPGHCGS